MLPLTSNKQDCFPIIIQGPVWRYQIVVSCYDGNVSQIWHVLVMLKVWNDDEYEVAIDCVVKG